MSTVVVEPSGESCGAIVRGVDLRAPLPAELVAELRAVWLEHLVIAFPDQDLTLDELERVATCFGPFGVDPFIRPLPDHPHVIEVKRAADEEAPIFADVWHSDWSFLPTPPAGTMLYGVEIPPVGGDTLYANQYAAYDALPAEMQERLEGLQGVHSAQRGYAPTGAYGDRDRGRGRSMEIISSEDAYATQLHPLVRIHPETGRRALYCSIAYTIGIDGIDETEAQELLMFLYQHCGRDDFVYRHRWSTGMLTLWDNRCLLHAATGGYDGYARRLWRITVAERSVTADPSVTAAR